MQYYGVLRKNLHILIPLFQSVVAYFGLALAARYKVHNLVSLVSVRNSRKGQGTEPLQPCFSVKHPNPEQVRQEYLGVGRRKSYTAGHGNEISGSKKWISIV